MELQYIQEMPETQFATVPSKVMADPPERLLAIAVLTGAINDLVKFRGRRGREAEEMYNDARDWVLSDDERWPYSFVNLCALLELPTDRLRRFLLDNPGTVTYDLRALAA